MFCSNCGTKNEDGAKFCANCGTAFEEATETASVEAAPVEAAPVETAPVETAPVETAPYCEDDASNYEANDEKKSKIKKIITVAVIVAVVAAIAIFAVKLIGGLFGDKDQFDVSNHPLIYLKEDEVKVNPAGKKDSYELGDTDSISGLKITDDGKVIFYADDYDDGEFDLYYRKSADKKSEGIKIDKGVSEFYIVPGTKDVVYLKSDELIYHNLKKEREIADKVVDFYDFSEDGSKIAFEDEDGTVYISGLGKNAKPEKIDSEISLVDISEDYKTVYYTKEEKLYKKELGKDKEKLASDVYDAYVLDNNVFVIKSEDKEYKYDDLFINDIEDEMENLVDPDSIEKPNYDDYGDYDAYSDAYDEYWDAYNDAYDEWYKYEGFMGLEDEYNENPVTISSYVLYQLKGKDLTKIDENLESYGWSFYEESGIGVYKKKDGDGFKKIKISSLESRWDVYSKINEQIYGGADTSLYILTSAGKSFLAFDDTKDIYDYEISEDGKEIYVLDKKSGKEEGELKNYKIGSSKISGEKVVSKDVASFSLWEDGNIIVTDKGGEKTLVRKNGKTVSLGDDVVNLTYKDGVFYYIADYSHKSSDGDLTYCENGKVKKIADDVHDYKVFSEKRIAYIAEYDNDDGCGELYIGKKNGKAKLIDDEVRAIY